MISWLPIDETSDFSLQNLPYGVFSAEGRDQRIGVAVGRYALDMKVLAGNAVFSGLDFDATALQEPNLNRYAALGRTIHRQVRKYLQDLLDVNTSLGHVLRDNDVLKSAAFIPQAAITLHLPLVVGDYTDFFVVPYHAQNCTNIFRPGQSLPPAFFEQPLGYHGRASSVVVSGTPVQRPKGQFMTDDRRSVFEPTAKLDYEVEFAAFIGQGNAAGRGINVEDAEDHIFGLVLLNDWSARDIQRREAAPLGPFNGKNFSTSVSPWIVSLDALEPYRASALPKNGPLLGYLDDKKETSVHDVPIKVQIQAESETFVIAQANAKNVVFSFAQMLAHHTAGGCPMRTGDLIATGTLSGPRPSEYGCLLEVTRDGVESAEFVGSNNQTLKRTFLEDGDNVIFSAHLPGKGGLGAVGFGSCEGRIVASHP